LLDRLENRLRRSGPSLAGNAPAARPIKVRLADLDLPGYLSQTDPEPRLIANRQLHELARQKWLDLAWLPGESGHLLESVTLISQDPLYVLLERESLADRQDRLETLLLADRFRFPEGDGAQVRYAIEQVRAGKSPSPFSLTTWTGTWTSLPYWSPCMPEALTAYSACPRSMTANVLRA
jgi:hypothetical protein